MESTLGSGQSSPEKKTRVHSPLKEQNPELYISDEIYNVFGEKIQDQFDVTTSHGFMPAIPPLVTLPEDFADLERIISKMTYHQPDGSAGLLKQRLLAKTVDEELPDYTDKVRQTSDSQLLASLFRDYSFLTSAYVLEDAYHELPNDPKHPARGVLPRKLAVPFQIIADKFSCNPWLEYSRGYTQYNFKKKDENLPHTVENLTVIRSFSGLDSEAGFNNVHNAIDASSAALVENIHEILRKVNKNEDFLENLEKILAMTQEANQIIKEMFTVNKPEEFSNFRFFLVGIKDNRVRFPQGLIYEGVSPEPKYYFGSSASLNMYMPTVEAFFGIDKGYCYPSVINTVDELRYYFPVQFQRYLKFLASSPEVRKFHAKMGCSPKVALTLMKIFKELVQFRSTHWNLLKTYIIKQAGNAVGTGGTNALVFLSDPLIFTQRKVQEMYIKFKQVLEGTPEHEEALDIYNQAVRKEQGVINDKMKLLHPNYEEYTRCYLEILAQSEFTPEFTNLLDYKDFLKGMRSEFFNVDQRLFFNSHQGGLVSRYSVKAIQEQVKVWEQGQSTDQGHWLSLQDSICSKLSEIVGAKPHQLKLVPSFQVGLHSLLDCFSDPHSPTTATIKKKKILLIEGEPSDCWAVRGWLQLRGVKEEELVVREECAKEGPRSIEQILEKIRELKEEVGVVIASQVQKYYGTFLESLRIQEACRQHGIAFILDLSTAAGVVPLYIRNWHIDAAIFGTDRFLLGGPGSPACICLSEDHLEDGSKGSVLFKGARSESDQMNLIEDGLPLLKTNAFDILSLSKLDAALNLFSQAEPLNIQKKSYDLLLYIHKNLKSLPTLQTFNFEQSSSFVALRSTDPNQDTETLFGHLKNNKVECDYVQKLDVIRISVHGCYNSFADCEKLYQTIKTFAQ